MEPGAWLDGHDPEIPESLRARMRVALEAVTDEVDSRSLVNASLLCMRDALDLGDDRPAAIHLLAADALLTAAFADVAAGGAESIRSLAGQATAELALLLPAPAE